MTLSLRIIHASKIGLSGSNGDEPAPAEVAVRTIGAANTSIRSP